MIAKGIEMLNDVTDYSYGLNGMVRGGKYVLKADVLNVLDAKDAEIAETDKVFAAHQRTIAKQSAEIAALKTDRDRWKEICVMYNTKYSEGTVEIAALRHALEVLIDIEDDAANNPPEHRCYIEGAWKMAMDEARAAIAQAVQP